MLEQFIITPDKFQDSFPSCLPVI